MPPRAVLLDLYDTLACVDADAYERHMMALAHRARAPAARFRIAWDATAKEATLGRLRTTEDRAATVLQALGSAADPTLLAAREEQFQNEAARLYDGVPEALAALRVAGLRLAIVGNGTASVRAVPARLGLLSLVDAVVFSFAVGAAKPEPAIYLAACARLGVLPEQCLFAGDGGGRELDGAAALGMITVWIDQPRNSAWGTMTSTIIHHRLAAIAALPALLDKLIAMRAP